MRAVRRLGICALLAGCFCLFGSGHVLAQSSQALETLLAPYPRAEVVETTERKVVDYRLATGATRKVSGRWTPESELRKAGEIRRLTQLIPEGHGPEEVFRHYRERVAALNGRAIFVCRERDCGSSNAWANNIFEVKQLYGSDQDQYYGIFEFLDEQDQLNYVTVYTVRRGNGRVYTHVELLETRESSAAGAAPNPDAIVEQLKEQGYYSVSGVQLKGGELVFRQEHIDALARALRSSRRLGVRIVGHDYGPPPLEAQRERSLGYAGALMQALVAAGVDEDRLEAHGVGSLVPMRFASARREEDFRLELVLIE